MKPCSRALPARPISTGLPIKSRCPTRRGNGARCPAQTRAAARAAAMKLGACWSSARSRRALRQAPVGFAHRRASTCHGVAVVRPARRGQLRAAPLFHARRRIPVPCTARRPPGHPRHARACRTGRRRRPPARRRGSGKAHPRGAPASAQARVQDARIPVPDLGPDGGCASAAGWRA